MFDFRTTGCAITLADAEMLGGRIPRGRPAQVVEVRTGQPLTPVLRLAFNSGKHAVRRSSPLGMRTSWSPVEGSADLATSSVVTANADRLLVLRQDDSIGLYDLNGDDRSSADLEKLAELLSGRHVNSAGLVQELGPSEYRASLAIETFTIRPGLGCPRCRGPHLASRATATGTKRRAVARREPFARIGDLASGPPGRGRTEQFDLSPNAMWIRRSVGRMGRGGKR